MEWLTAVSPQDWVEMFDLSKRPLLKAARENASPAHSVRVEWLVERVVDGGFRHAIWHNFTQILRQPFTQGWLKSEGRRQTFTEAAKEAGEKILDDAEMTLWYGTPTRDVNIHLTTCGGVRHYLKRRVYENDTVSLRELQTLVLLRDCGEGDEFRAEEDRRHEWLWEFSLQVNPGHYQRGMTPLFLPPKLPASTPKAWRQGACLNDKE